MNTDLKARAEALLAALKVDGFKYIAGRPLDDLPWLKEAIAAFMEAADAATVLALIRERDEAREERDDLAQSLKQIMVADREAIEAALSAAQEEVARMQRWLSYVERELAAAMERGQLHHSLHVLVTGTQEPTDG